MFFAKIARKEQMFGVTKTALKNSEERSGLEVCLTDHKAAVKDQIPDGC
jgi:hypothetical protein